MAPTTEGILIVLTCWLAFATLSQALRITWTRGYIEDRRNDLSETLAAVEAGPQLIIIVPALRETRTIATCIEHFSGLGAVARNVRLLVVCSRAERPQLAGQTGTNPTLLAAEAAATEVNRRLGFRFSTAIEYPYDDGRMAHQINWGVRYLYKAIDAGIDPYRTVLGVFNADSRPSADALKHVLASFADGQVEVAQQASLYRVAEGSSWSAVVPSAAALWQTRWSIAVELPRYRSSRRLAAWLDKRVRRDWRKHIFRMLTPNAYVVGHGVWLRLNYLTELNYFPTEILNEDAALGYAILADGRSPEAVGGFDVAEVPQGLKTLVLQQAVWFGGPALAPSYPAFARGVGALVCDSQFEAASAHILAARTFADALIWLGGPALFVVLCALAATTGHTLTGVAVTAFLAYLVIPSLLVGVLFPLGRDSWRSVAVGTLGMPLFYVLHGAGAGLWIYWRLRATLTKSPLPKPKTER